MAELPTACVIGAGSSGIAAAKALHMRGFDFDCFEISDRVGGNWVFKNRNGLSAAYRSLHVNTSRRRTEYSDFPMPSDYPDYPHHTQLARYFEAYVDHFGFRERIRFNTRVEHAAPAAGGGWEVRLDRGETRRYDALLVANGHHWDPRRPDPPFPGADVFEGEQLHSHDYTGDDPGLFRDKRVVVLGMGNSAMDIAVDAASSAAAVYLAARRGVWVLPKHMFGRPVDQYPMPPRVPFRLRQLVVSGMVRLAVGPMERYGLPKPDHRLLEAHPTLSDGILSRLSHGDIRPKPNIARLTAEHRRLAFIGLLQPLGAIMPLAELQSEWVCDELEGRYVLPSAAEMRRHIARERKRMFRRYVPSARHTMEVDFEDYVAEVNAERRRGAARAQTAAVARDAVAA